MGVFQLWKLLSPSGRRVDMRSLKGQIVAIDISIWISQFLSAMKDNEDKIIPYAHILGTFRRIVRLLSFGIRPLFVFDGPAPAIKRRTLLNRRAMRESQELKFSQAAQKLYLMQVQQILMRRVVEEKRKKMLASQGVLENASEKADLEDNVDVVADSEVAEFVPPGKEKDQEESASPATTGDIELTSSRGIDDFLEESEENLEELEGNNVPDTSVPAPAQMDAALHAQLVSRGIVDPLRISESEFAALKPAMQLKLAKYMKDVAARTAVTSLISLAADPEAFSSAQMRAFRDVASVNTRVSALLDFGAAQSLQSSLPGRSAGAVISAGTHSAIVRDIDAVSEGDSDSEGSVEFGAGFIKEEVPQSSLSLSESLSQAHSTALRATRSNKRSMEDLMQMQGRVFDPGDPNFNLKGKKINTFSNIETRDAIRSYLKNQNKLSASQAEHFAGGSSRVSEEAGFSLRDRSPSENKWKADRKVERMVQRAFDPVLRRRTQLQLGAQEAGRRNKRDRQEEADAVLRVLRPGAGGFSAHAVHAHAEEAVRRAATLSELLNAPSSSSAAEDLEEVKDSSIQSPDQSLAKQQWLRSMYEAHKEARSSASSVGILTYSALVVLAKEASSSLPQPLLADSSLVGTRNRVSVDVAGVPMHEPGPLRVNLDFEQGLSIPVHPELISGSAAEEKDKPKVYSVDLKARRAAELRAEAIQAEEAAERRRRAEMNAFANMFGGHNDEEEEDEVEIVEPVRSSQRDDVNELVEEPGAAATADVPGSVLNRSISPNEVELNEVSATSGGGGRTSILSTTSEDQSTARALQAWLEAPESLLHASEVAASSLFSSNKNLNMEEVEEEEYESPFISSHVSDSSAVDLTLSEPEPSDDEVWIDLEGPSSIPALEEVAESERTTNTSIVSTPSRSEMVDLRQFSGDLQTSSSRQSFSDGDSATVFTEIPESSKPAIREAVDIAESIGDISRRTAIASLHSIIGPEVTGSVLRSLGVRGSTEAVREASESVFRQQFERVVAASESAQILDSAPEDLAEAGRKTGMHFVPGPADNVLPPHSAPAAVIDSNNEVQLSRDFRKREEQERAELSAASRVPTSFSRSTFTDVMWLLDALGVPYLVAAGEAEAQCALLQRAGVVDAVMSEDSDCLLFGAGRVLRGGFGGGSGSTSVEGHAISNGDIVDEFRISDVEDSLGFNRDSLIELALLLGSDYTGGVVGVGLVNAVEILAAFPTVKHLVVLRQWILLSSMEKSLQAQPGLQSDEDCFALGAVVEGVTVTAAMVEFLDTHRAALKRWKIETDFPSSAVVDAYLQPAVHRVQAPSAEEAVLLRSSSSNRKGRDDIEGPVHEDQSALDPRPVVHRCTAVRRTTAKLPGRGFQLRSLSPIVGQDDTHTEEEAGFQRETLDLASHTSKGRERTYAVDILWRRPDRLAVENLCREIFQWTPHEIEGYVRPLFLPTDTQQTLDKYFLSYGSKMPSAFIQSKRMLNAYAKIIGKEKAAHLAHANVFQKKKKKKMVSDEEGA